MAAVDFVVLCCVFWFGIKCDKFPPASLGSSPAPSCCPFLSQALVASPPDPDTNWPWGPKSLATQGPQQLGWVFPLVARARDSPAGTRPRALGVILGTHSLPLPGLSRSRDAFSQLLESSHMLHIGPGPRASRPAPTHF